MNVVVDIQGFLLNDGFDGVVKELEMSDRKMLNHFVFKPKRSYHRLEWN